MYEADASARNGQFMVGILWGAAAGVALGLLLAPKTGAEFRSQIADKAERFRRRAGSKFDDVAGTVNEMVDKGRRKYNRAMDTVDEFVERGRDAVEEGREAFAEAQSEAERRFS
jgi:gas vesicle protein